MNMMRRILIISLSFIICFLATPLFLETGVNFNIFGKEAWGANKELKVDFGPKTYKNSDVPIILPRSTWENSPDLINLLDWYPEEKKDQEENSPPDYFSIDRIIIHDMGCNTRNPGCNDKTVNPVTIIQNIYRYHAVTRGWGDIGYHYIIDYWGNIYEGRYGGNGVRGAHTYYDRKCDNFNVGSVSILLMGNYEKTQPPEEMYKSLARLVAWLSVTNGLDPTDMNHTSEIWHSPRINNTKNSFKCDISQGGLTSTYTGPVVVGHKDVEAGNSDPGVLDLSRVREEAKTLYLKYKNYLYKSKNSSKVFKITNGIRTEINSGSRGGYKIIEINKSQLDIFPSSKKFLYSNGTLVKSFTRPRVYLIENNKRRPILSEKIFNARKFNWSKIKILSDRDLAVYSLAAPLPFPDGTLIKGSGPEIYLVENGKRRHISLPILFDKLNFDWNKVIQVSQTELLAHPLGEKILLPDNVLVKEKNSPPVYLIKNSKRYWIKSINVFKRLGFDWKDIIVLEPWEIKDYLMGSAIETVEDFATLEKKEEIISPQDKEPKPETENNVSEPIIRVGIYSVSPGKNIVIKANKKYEVYKNDLLLAVKNANELITIPYSKTDYYKIISLEKDAIFEIVSYENRPKWNPEINDNLFRGNLEIKYSNKSQKVWVINELYLEDYLKGVAEALNSDPLEYLKAFVVAARSYALFHIKNSGKVPGEIFHLRNWAFDQLYKGYGFEKRAPNIAKAVEETRGIIGKFNGKVVRAVYSSDSGGVTKNACEVFKGVFCESSDYDYLKGGVKDPEGTIHSKSAILASHGVGMSSAGARRLAEMGKTFEEILKYYYLGIEVEKIY